MGRQDFRRPNLVGPILQNPQPRRFAAGAFPLKSQPGAAFANAELRLVRRHGIQPRGRRHERGLGIEAAQGIGQGGILGDAAQVKVNFAAEQTDSRAI